MYNTQPSCFPDTPFSPPSPDAAEGPESGQEFSPGGQRSSEVHLLKEAEAPAADVEVVFAPGTRRW